MQELSVWLVIHFFIMTSENLSSKIDKVTALFKESSKYSRIHQSIVDLQESITIGQLKPMPNIDFEAIKDLLIEKDEQILSIIRDIIDN